MLNGLCDVEIVSDPDALRLRGTTTPFIRLKHLRTDTGTDVTIELTINLAHLIGGVAAGASERFGLP
jgi:hypothetical protein